MEFIKTTLEGAVLIRPAVYNDRRGFFLESYSLQKFRDAGIDCVFVQDNHSRSVEKGVLRGLHFQKPPFAQSKLIRVTRGAIYDVIVDLRKGSPTFGQWEGYQLTDQNFTMLFVPQGFAHGFCTTECDTEVQYKVDNYYSPSHDSGILWNDQSLGIQWPLQNPVLSEKDQRLQSFKDLNSPF